MRSPRRRRALRVRRAHRAQRYIMVLCPETFAFNDAHTHVRQCSRCAPDNEQARRRAVRCDYGYSSFDIRLQPNDSGQTEIAVRFVHCSVLPLVFFLAA